MKILAFIYTFAPDGDFDSYMVEVVNGFENVGAELYVIKSNELINRKRGTLLQNNKRIDSYIKKTIEKIQPDFILSINRGGISKSILKNFNSIPIITLMVDLMFFKSSNFGEKTIFRDNDHLITATFAAVNALEKKFPELKGRVYYLPVCTRKEDFNHTIKKDINISFIGNLFGKSKKLIALNKNDKKFRSGFFKFIEEVNNSYHLDDNYYLTKYNIKDKLIAKRYDPDKLLYIAANIISTNDRIKTLDAVSDLGLRIYGPEKWYETISYSHKLASCYQFNEYIKTRKQLCSIYDRTKIGININHHQATSGFGYRVVDILASSALLITNFQEDSDFKRLFGKDHKIPTYRSPEELRNKIVYFLNHEEKRKELVAYCNQLVAKGFSFEERAAQIIQIAYPAFVPLASNKIKAKYISIPKFYTWRF